MPGTDKLNLREMLERWQAEGRSWESREYYPAILDLNGRNCLVVGAGKVGAEKIGGLLAASATVKVVSKEASAPVTAMAERGQIELELRPYREDDLERCFLVIAATENEETNREVFKQAEKRGMLCNVVDVPELCNFIVPSVHRDEDLIIAISTGGASPALARKIRLELASRYGPEYALELKVLGSLRDELKARYPNPGDRKRVFERIVYSDIFEWITNGQSDKIEAWIDRCIEEGPGYAIEKDHKKLVG